MRDAPAVLTDAVIGWAVSIVAGLATGCALYVVYLACRYALIALGVEL